MIAVVVATIFPSPAPIADRIRVLADLVEPAFTLTVLADEPGHAVRSTSAVASRNNGPRNMR